MSQFSALSPQHFWSKYSAARAARTLPWGWRLWSGALAAGLLIHWLPTAIPLVALAGLMVSWNALHRYASAYSDHKLEHRWANGAAFVAVLSTALAFVAASIVTIGWRLQEAGYGLELLILIAMGIGVLLAYAVVRQWWEGRFALLAALSVPTVGSLCIWAAVQPIPSEAVSNWQTSFARLSAVMLTMGAFDALSRTRWLERMQSMRWLSSVGESVVFAVILSALLPLTERNTSLADARSVAVVAMATAMTLACLVRARFRIQQDGRWLASGTWFRAPERTAPNGPFAAFASLPAVMLAPLAGPVVWWTCFALGAAAALLGRFGNYHQKPLRSPGPKPSEKTEPLELVAA